MTIFDNGVHRKGIEYSRAIEIDPKTKKTIWEYARNARAAGMLSGLGEAVFALGPALRRREAPEISRPKDAQSPDAAGGRPARIGLGREL